MSAPSERLLPCPFCGNPDVQDDEGCYPTSRGWQVLCGDPFCNASISGETRELTVAKWNRRPTAVTATASFRLEPAGA